VAGTVPERARQALEAGADMALICNDPEAVGATLDALRSYQNPAGHARLVAMRAHAPRQRVAELRASVEWQQASTLLAEAIANPGRPTLKLHG
jgi:beta-N-acetylhexosaminidase